MNLTDKQAKFVKAYLADPHRRNAAIKAGYSESGASVEANRLLKHPKVIAALDRGKQKTAQSTADMAAVAFVPNLLAALDIGKSPLDYMLGVMNDNEAENERRDKMATAAAPYMHMKKGEGGKKDEKQEAAKKAGAGKFAPAAPPKLVVNNK